MLGAVSVPYFGIQSDSTGKMNIHIRILVLFLDPILEHSSCSLNLVYFLEVAGDSKSACSRSQCTRETIQGYSQNENCMSTTFVWHCSQVERRQCNQLKVPYKYLYFFVPCYYSKSFFTCCTVGCTAKKPAFFSKFWKKLKYVATD